MQPQLARWIAAVLVVGVIGVAASVLSSSPDSRGVTTAAPRTVTATPRATTSSAPPTTASPIATTTAPLSSTTPDAPAPSAPPASAQPVSLANAPAPSPAAAPIPEVALYGDSLTVLASQRYQEITYGEVATHEHALVGATLPDWSAAIQSDPVDRLVLALGTNDAEKDGAKPWADLLNALPTTTCIVWPKTYEGSSAVQLFNAQMAAVIAAHPNVHVIDWDASAKAHPEWVEPDHIHYTSEGSDHYAEMLKQAALTCP